MRQLLTIVAAFVLLLAICWGVGFMEPLDHTATYTAVVPADVDAVWYRIADVEQQPAWRKGLTVAPAPPQDGRPCWHETEGKVQMLMCVAASKQPVLREVELSSPGMFNGTWVYQLQAVSPTQTRVQMTETVMIYRPWLRFLMLVVGRDFLSRQVVKQLAASFGGKPVAVK